MDVDESELRALVALCDKVLETKDSTLLPPTEGFFFGGTEVGEYYWEMTKHTSEEITKALTFAKLSGINVDYEYRASW